MLTRILLTRNTTIHYLYTYSYNSSLPPLTSTYNIRQIGLYTLVRQIAIPLRRDFAIERVQRLRIGHEHGARLCWHHIMLLLLLGQLRVHQAAVGAVSPVQLVMIAARTRATSSSPEAGAIEERLKRN